MSAAERASESSESVRSGKNIFVSELNASISYSFNPLCIALAVLPAAREILCGVSASIDSD